MEEEEFGKTFLCSCKEFSLELYDIRIQAEESSNAEEFFIFTVVDGNGEIVYEDGSEKLQKGSSIFIPASLGRYIIKGKMKLLKSYVT
jgi:mannose-6-phosphate isomerase